MKKKTFYILIVIICSKTTVSYETRKLTEMEFPMYFSLVPTPGYNISHLETCGIYGEWELFTGFWNKSVWEWGGNCSIEGNSDSLGRESEETYQMFV